MVQRTVKVVVILALLMAVVTGSAGASVLTNIGTAKVGADSTAYNLIYDSGASLLWLDYTHAYSNWADANAWATTGLSLNTIVTPGYIVDTSGWRLPTTVPAVVGYNQTGSEMGHLYYTDLGLTAGTSVSAGNQGPFANILPDWYWSGTEYAAYPSYAWYFHTGAGLQYADSKGNPNYALAVRPGQLLTSAVPEPSTYFLLCIGLGAVGYARRKLKYGQLRMEN